MTKKNELTPKEQQEVIRSAYGDFYARLQSNDWLGAFLIAFGLLENRINTMDRYERDFRFSQGLESSTNSLKHRPLNNRVNYLEFQKRLHPEEAEEIRQIGDVRNQIIHDLVWATKEIDDQLCLHVLDLERKAKNARNRQKYRHKKLLNQSKQP